MEAGSAIANDLRPERTGIGVPVDSQASTIGAQSGLMGRHRKSGGFPWPDEIRWDRACNPGLAGTVCRERNQLNVLGGSASILVLGREPNGSLFERL